MKSVADQIRRLQALGATVGPAARLPVSAPLAGESEQVFAGKLIDLAHSLGYLAYHAIPLKTSKGWRTGTQGDTGFPDVVLAKAGRVLMSELKVKGRVREPDQELWATAVGSHARLWLPEMWDLIVAELGG